MPGGWAGSTRTATLPRNWPTIRPQVLARDPICRWGSIPEDNADQPCHQPATDADHIGDRHNHTLTNLRGLCRWHHARRSSAQGNQAKHRNTTRRPNEPHPGLRNTP